MQDSKMYSADATVCLIAQSDGAPLGDLEDCGTCGFVMGVMQNTGCNAAALLLH